MRVRSSSTFLISDVGSTNVVAGPVALEVSYDPAQLPSGEYRIVAADAGLIALSTDGTGTGTWNPVVSVNSVVPGSLAQPNFLGPYATFWSNVTTANPSATLKDVVGSSGVDLTGRTAWAVVNQPGGYAVGTSIEYAVTDTVFTEQVISITVS